MTATTTEPTLRDLRAAAARNQPDTVPAGQARSQRFPTQLRAGLVDLNGQSFYKLEGYASVVDRGYEMWDMWGPYTEVVAPGAFDKTLSEGPDVAFLVNHRGLTMARTIAKEGLEPRLELDADATGLHVVAYLNPKRQDVKDLKIAIDDGDITEMSFAFMITRGQWSSDWAEYHIEEVDLDRGDVSAVNYGASPYTSIAARSGEILDDLAKLPDGAKRAALQRLQPLGALRVEQTVTVEPPAPPVVETAVTRSDESQPDEPEHANSEPAERGRSVALVRKLLLDEDD